MKEYLNNNKFNMFVLTATFMLAGVALGTAFRLYQLRTTPITPVSPGLSEASNLEHTKESCEEIVIVLALPSPSASPTASPSPSPTGGTAQCLDIKVFDESWEQYTDLASAFSPGTVVRFTIGADVTFGEVQKAKFFINGVDKGETSSKRPSSEEFYYEYTIPEGLNQILIEAEVFHNILGWF